MYGHNPIGDTDNDLTRQHAGEPMGERIEVAGRVLDEHGRPIPVHADRSRAGERGRPVFSCAQQSRCAAQIRTSSVPSQRARQHEHQRRVPIDGHLIAGVRSLLIQIHLRGRAIG
jgi:hypothetical protein